jgi:hypothetical protein
LPRIIMHPKAWDAGYADGLVGRPHGTDPLSQVDALAYASGYVEGKAAAADRIERVIEAPLDPAGNPMPGTPMFDSEASDGLALVGLEAAEVAR